MSPAPGGAVDVWWVAVDPPPSRAGRLEHKLQERAAARQALRAVLAHTSGPHAGVSLSRAPGRAVAALSAGPVVGVDVEWVERDLDHWALARRFYTATEVAALRRLPPAAARARFFEWWTWKEAVLKAAGVGLGAPLPARIGPRGDTGPQAHAYASLLAHEQAVTWWPEPGYVVTLVTGHPAPAVRWRRWPARPRPTQPTAATEAAP